MKKMKDVGPRDRFVDLATKIALGAMVFRELAETYFRIRLWMNREKEGAMEEGKSKVSYLTPERVNVTFKDLVGFEKTKAELKSALEWPLKHRDLMKTYDLEPIGGVCLFGPPGCGKTHFARCAAGEFRVKLYLVSPSTIGSMWYGQTEKRIRRLFEEARKSSPSIIAIDEADKLLSKGSGSSVHPRILSEFLQNMDGLLSEDLPVVVLLMTNEPWKMHEAIMRRGRVDRLIYVPPPDFESRLKLFRHYMSKAYDIIDKGINYDELAKATEPSEKGYYSSAAIKEICRTAKEEAFRSALSLSSKVKISMDHFRVALQKVPPDIDLRLVRKYDEWAREHASYASL